MGTLKLLKLLQCTTKPAVTFRTQIRQSSYKSSPFLVDLGEIKTKYEISRDPEEWKHVENVLPPTLIPEPKKKATYASGWQAPSENLFDKPYYVERTKNHMIPVYLERTHRNMRRLTFVKRIKGDIWLLEEELREFLQKENRGLIRSQVNEFAGYICFHGDHVNAIKYYLLKKGL